MSAKTIRIWRGNEVLQVVTVSQGGSSSIGAVGGASNSTKVDIEIDPFAGLIVDHSTGNAPYYFREVEQ